MKTYEVHKAFRHCQREKVYPDTYKPGVQALPDDTAAYAVGAGLATPVEERKAVEAAPENKAAPKRRTRGK